MAIFTTLDNGNFKINLPDDDELSLKEALMLTYAIKLLNAITAYDSGFLLQLIQKKVEQSLEFPNIESLCKAHSTATGNSNIPFDQWKVETIDELSFHFKLTPNSHDFPSCHKKN